MARTYPWLPSEIILLKDAFTRANGNEERALELLPERMLERHPGRAVHNKALELRLLPSKRTSIWSVKQRSQSAPIGNTTPVSLFVDGRFKCVCGNAIPTVDMDGTPSCMICGARDYTHKTNIRRR